MIRPDIDNGTIKAYYIDRCGVQHWRVVQLPFIIDLLEVQQTVFIIFGKRDFDQKNNLYLPYI